MRPTDRGASVRTISRRGFLTMAASGPGSPSPGSSRTRQRFWFEGLGCAKLAKRGLVLTEYVDGHPERAGILRAHILGDVLKQRHGAFAAGW